VYVRVVVAAGGQRQVEGVARALALAGFSFAAAEIRIRAAGVSVQRHEQDV
jgi:hypothetical protein